MENKINPADMTRGHEKLPKKIDPQGQGKEKVIVNQTPKGPPPSPKK